MKNNESKSRQGGGIQLLVSGADWNVKTVKTEGEPDGSRWFPPGLI